MPSLKDLRNRIRSVRSTQKITSAMKMVAASRLRRAQEQAEAARPYAERMERVLASLAARTSGLSGGPALLAGTGKDLHTTVNSGDGQVTVAFSPGDGAFIDQEYARRVAEAKDSVHIASMVISSPEMLKALADKINEGVPVTGVGAAAVFGSSASKFGVS